MKLSFVILNYKTPHHLRLCVKNIQDLGLDFPHEILVIDNASGDESVEMMQREFPDITLVANGKNLGHPAGNNVGFRLARGEYVVMVNPDIVFRQAEDIQNVLAYLDSHEQEACVGPRLHNPDGSIQNSCYRKYSRWTPVFRRTILGKLPWGKRDTARHLMLDFDHNDTRSVEWLLGACMFIRRSAMEKIGMMDERLFLYFGDYEWCDRARQAGFDVVYFHDTHGIYHYHKRESASRRFSVTQALSYVTRIHLKDWKTYLAITKQYAKSAPDV